MGDVRVGTVDSFQGQETDLVLFSSVRSNLMRELGFLRDARRLNVAITRARRGLIIVGDYKVLRTCPHWSALLASCAERRCSLTYVEYKAKTNSMLNRVTEPNVSNWQLKKDEKFCGLFDTDDEDDVLLGLFPQDEDLYAFILWFGRCTLHSALKK